MSIGYKDNLINKQIGTAHGNHPWEGNEKHTKMVGCSSGTMNSNHLDLKIDRDILANLKSTRLWMHTQFM